DASGGGPAGGEERGQARDRRGREAAPQRHVGTRLVPSPIDHGDLPGVAGDGDHAVRHAVAFADHAGIDLPSWAGGASDGVAWPWPGLPYTLELHDSRCLIRFARPASAEPPAWNDLQKEVK
ncbi:hypothetical protein AB0K48_59835, partial [Nonomuraea sp. NPDC055795]